MKTEPNELEMYKRECFEIRLGNENDKEET